MLNKKWYIIYVQSGMEKSVLNNLKKKINASEFKNFFGDIIIPKEDIIEVKNGSKKIIERKIFPGYMIIEMFLNDETCLMVKNIPNVTCFLGNSKNKPTPINKKEVDRISSQIKEGYKKPKPRIQFNLGEFVRIKDGGPFSEFSGSVENINYEKNKITVSVAIFGRFTPVELNFNQIEKI